MRTIRLCARCGHALHLHRRPVVFWAVLGRWTCRHRYYVRGHGTWGTVGCQCDGWKPA